MMLLLTQGVVPPMLASGKNNFAGIVSKHAVNNTETTTAIIIENTYDAVTGLLTTQKMKPDQGNGSVTYKFNYIKINKYRYPMATAGVACVLKNIGDTRCFFVMLFNS